MVGRSLVAALLCFLTFFNFGVLGVQTVSRELTIADIPACGLRCLFEVLPRSGCSAADIACICASSKLEQELAASLLANCTMQEMLDSSRVQASMCHLSNDSKSWDVILYTCIVFSIALASVILRLIGKWASSRLSWDDFMVAGAIILTVIPLYFVLHMALNGFGEHLWNLDDGKLSDNLFSIYISWTSYVVVLCMIKISLILFYLEIFKTREFRITAYTFLVYLVTNTIIMIGFALFPCHPINSFWDRDIKNGKCVDLQVVAYFISASSLLQDIILLIMPLVFIRNLQMKRQRKIAVGIMFIIGTFGCIATLMRLPSLSTFKISIDPCWDYVAVTVWSQIELGTGFVCVCLPSIRILLVKVFPETFKKLVSSFTNSGTGSKSNDTPQPQRVHPSKVEEWSNKGSTWVKVSTNTDKLPTVNPEKPPAPGTPIRSSFLSAFWRQRKSSQPPVQLSHLRNNSRRLESPLSNHSQVGIAVTAPSVQEEKNAGRFEDVEMMGVSAKAKKHMSTSCQSCRGDKGAFTALPQIGCIPEGNYSAEDLSEIVKREREKDMV